MLATITSHNLFIFKVEESYKFFENFKKFFFGFRPVHYLGKVFVLKTLNLLKYWFIKVVKYCLALARCKNFIMFIHFI